MATVERITPPVAPAYTVTLTEEEASALLEVCWHIAGRVNGPRGFFSEGIQHQGGKSLLGQLQRAGVRRPTQRATGSVSF